MKRLCFGSFLKILVLCKSPSGNQKKICGKMLLSINKLYNITTDDTAVSNLVRCERNLSDDITSQVIYADASNVSEYFKQHIIPMLDTNKCKQTVLSLLDIINSDTTIDEATQLGKLCNHTKRDILNMKTFVLADFLTNIFIYTIKDVINTEGKTSIAKITEEYVSQFESQKDTISFNVNPILPMQEITKTVKGKNFDSIFNEVTHYETLNLKNPHQLRIFHLDVVNNEFSFSALHKFLLRNIGSYVFSRAKIEQFYLDDEMESIGLSAVRLMHKNGSQGLTGTSDALGEMLLYSFLEEVLGAPKLMSKFELKSSSSQYNSKSDGIHLLSLGDNNGLPCYQLVFGATSIIGDLQDAVDKSFESLKEIKNGTRTEMQLVESTIFNQTFDEKTTNRIKQILIPTKGSKVSADMAFGVFLGYSLGLDGTEYTNLEFREEATRKMELAIQAQASYIEQKIKNLNMCAYSFYFYVLPFNDAIENKKDIINELLTGGVTL
ncbi:MAG: HamA C-terminal domain-containing protein [Clostridium sp.]|uniref:HamA C-terminal domain-containing protein n=1 Tax=Clostridium sp. TaxID=1506 RepID=UPI003D6D60E7